jgi:uncharacterized protein YciI
MPQQKELGHAVRRPYAVTMVRGDVWKADLPLEGQEAWGAHAAFMDALEAEGFVALGGPLEGSSDVLLIIRAGSPSEITERLAADPWHRLGLLRIVRVLPWTLRLGKLP